MAPGGFSALWRSRQRLQAARSNTTASSVPIELTRSADVRILAPAEIGIAAPVPTEATGPGSSPTVTEPVAMGVGDYLDRTKAKEHVDRIDRFRILIMGRANAGKTTILQRLCNTVDRPAVFDGKGKKVDLTMVQASAARGFHDIEYELVFKSNPRFVFHDSCGFEAGSEAQFAKMKEFVMDRARTAKLEKRIHAIWYCIPLNESHRMVSAAEKKFFDECDTGHVPVIVLLTKADTLELEAVQEIEELQLERDQAKGMIDEIQERMLNESLLKVKERLNGLKFQPHAFILTGIRNEKMDLSDLLSCTTGALTDEILQRLLLSTQQSNLTLCIEFAVKKTLRSCMESGFGYNEPTQLAAALSIWFPFYHGRGLQGLQPLEHYGGGAAGGGLACSWTWIYSLEQLQQEEDFME